MTVSWPKARSPTPTSSRVPTTRHAQAASSSLADVLAKIKAHGTYVNVHTNDGNATPNEGPGDFPGGEIRGQLDK